MYFFKSSDSLFQPSDFDLEVRRHHKLLCTNPRQLLFILAHFCKREEEFLSKEPLKRGRKSVRVGVLQAGVGTHTAQAVTAGPLGGNRGGRLCGLQRASPPGIG